MKKIIIIFKKVKEPTENEISIISSYLAEVTSVLPYGVITGTVVDPHIIGQIKKLDFVDNVKFDKTVTISK
jgi:hypothetical protein